jgi:hypothetical protein
MQGLQADFGKQTRRVADGEFLAFYLSWTEHIPTLWHVICQSQSLFQLSGM